MPRNQPCRGEWGRGMGKETKSAKRSRIRATGSVLAAKEGRLDQRRQEDL